MPINFPTLRQLVDRTRSDVRAELPDSDPTVFGSFLRAMTDSLASRSYDLVLLVQQALDQFFPQTATDTFLVRWAGYEGLTRNPATTASGFVVFTGTAGTAIPANTLVNSASSNVYSTQAGASISANSFSITGITRSGTTATASAVGHPLASGVTLTVSGADQTEYNGAFDVTVIDADTFSYEVSGTPTTPATGTTLGAINSVRVLIESQLSGVDYNLDNGAVLTLNAAITNIDNIAYAQFEGVVGGTDLETDDQLRVRVLESRKNPVANFNAFAIEKQAKTVSGVTRVFVKVITPNIGDVTVYFFRDGDTSPIPSASNITTVKNKIVELLPATSDASNVYVIAPTITATGFTFSAISPDTPTMRTAITANLQAFFDDRAEFETDITEDQYRSAIIETQDVETGDFLDSFTLSSPSADITIGTGAIAGLGSVLYS
tara:strand:+ start:2080 stop:3384 length:1305 start_codon:yes stop_codon:yes gene_type:complete